MQLPGEMITSYATGPGKMVVRKVPMVGPADGLLLRIASSGICGSDRRLLASIREGSKDTLGHELVGEVVCSPDDHESWMDRMVGVAPRLGCGSCSHCTRDLPNLCLDRRTIGYQVPGGFSQFAAIPVEAIEGKNVVVLPDDMDPLVGVLAEPLSCVVNGLDLSSPRSGSTILVYGAGPMGQLFAMASGEITGDVFVVEPDPDRREFAISHGARSGFEPGSPDIPEAETIIVACSSPDAYREALEIAPAGATINLFGGLSSGIEIDSNVIHYRQLDVHGTSGSTPDQFSRAVEMLGRRPELGDIVTDVVGFTDLEKTIVSGPVSPGLHLKAVLDPWL
jgi:L-iditol 2-dehydrogenase